MAAIRDPRIQELSDERAMGNGWFVYLKDGFAFRDANENTAQHCFGADTLSEVRSNLREVKPCACLLCVKATGQ